ncbi:MAG: multidrug transporter subunit MdtC [Alphaproteobacteria bacterium]|nr:multidrug transporter subunit MdtC [Alphaproteobacteria bacterium]
MNPSNLFIDRPVATTLLMLSTLIAGLVGFFLLPVSTLPSVDFPTIEVRTFYPGASPDVMARTITAPLERQLGQMPGLTQMSSTSAAGASVITLQFSIDLALDIAEQQTQAAISAAQAILPKDLPAPPIYAKINPADAPILTLSVTSEMLALHQVQELADTRLAQKIAQIAGVGFVSVVGGERPAVRVQVNPDAASALGLNLDDIRTTIGAANVNMPIGNIEGPKRAFAISANDRLESIADYANLIIAYRNDAPVRLSDIAKIVEGADNDRIAAWAGRTPAIILEVRRQPGANVVAAVDSIKHALPALKETLPPGVDVALLTDRTVTIRASVHAVERDLVTAVILVALTILLFLRDIRATLIASLSAPLSLIGAFALMNLMDFSINNLTLLALTIGAGFVVDDSIVMIENIARHGEAGETSLEGARKGSRDIAFTILSLTTSLGAALIPLLFMKGVVGRLFHEFAVTLLVTILLSAVISLTLTPMLAARLPGSVAEGKKAERPRFYDGVKSIYARMLDITLERRSAMLLVAAATLAAVALFAIFIPKGFFPVQDAGLIEAVSVSPGDISFAELRARQEALADVVLGDPDVAAVSSNIGIDGTVMSPNSGRFLIGLRPHNERHATATEIGRRIQANAKRVLGVSFYVRLAQDLVLDANVGHLQNRLVLVGAEPQVLEEVAQKFLRRIEQLPQIERVSSMDESRGLGAYLDVDRDTAARFGITLATVDNALYDAFGQRIVSTIFTQSSQRRVILTIDPAFARDPQALLQLYLPSSFSAAGQTPLSAIAQVSVQPAPLQIEHFGRFPAVSISFDLRPGVAAGDAINKIEDAWREYGSIYGVRLHWAGSALAFDTAMKDEVMLIFAALFCVYVVLGILYESFIHPLTIISTLPSAGAGALAALALRGNELDMIGVIGIVLLIGIVKKNAIMMIDFALVAQHKERLAPEAAIRRACIVRLRPILMTTFVAMASALPLIFETGVGAEIRQPLGVAIIGGLAVSQVLTLFTTPAVYLTVERLSRRWSEGRKAKPLA